MNNEISNEVVSINISFNRFKKKSLLLTYLIYPENDTTLLDIRYKKLTKCIIKENIGNKIKEKRLSIECNIILTK